jgi:hypothetical protein
MIWLFNEPHGRQKSRAIIGNSVDGPWSIGHSPRRYEYYGLSTIDQIKTSREFQGTCADTRQRSPVSGNVRP